MQSINKIIICFALVFAIISCKKSDDKPTIISTRNVVFNYKTDELSSRIQVTNQLLMVDESGLGIGYRSREHSKNYNYRLRGVISPLDYQGTTLNITNIKFIDDLVFVSYEDPGSTYLGAIEAYNVRDFNHPKIVWQAIFKDVDIHSMAYLNNKLFIAGSINTTSGTTASTTPAILEVLQLNEEKYIMKVDTIIDLQAYEGFDVKTTNNYIYTTSGPNGGTFVFNPSYSVLNSQKLNNISGIAENGQNIFYLHNQPTVLNIVDKNSAVTKSSINISNIEATSPCIEATDNFIFASSNLGGIQMLNADGGFRQYLLKPEFGSKYSANSISINRDIVFAASKDSGLYVGGLFQNYNDSLLVTGKLKFSDGFAPSIVFTRDSLVFVASGNKLKFLSINTDEGMPFDVIKTGANDTINRALTADLPEYINITTSQPTLFSASSSKIVKLTQESEVFVTFLGEGAGWQNSLGYYTYMENETPSILNKVILFPNISLKSDGGALEPGDMVKLGNGKFPKGTVIGFYLVAKGWSNGCTQTGIYTHYTNEQFNVNKRQQHILFREKKSKRLIVGFEDTAVDQSSDKDYNDIRISISDTNNPLVVSTSFDLTNVVEL